LASHGALRGSKLIDCGSRTQAEKINGVAPDTIKAEIHRARALLVEIESLRKLKNGDNLDGAWVFGTNAPTALDTTLICFLNRLLDVNLEDIVPVPLVELGRKMRGTEQFKEIWATT
jgi:hypothetical protein